MAATRTVYTLDPPAQWRQFSRQARKRLVIHAEDSKIYAQNTILTHQRTTAWAQWRQFLRQARKRFVIHAGDSKVYIETLTSERVVRGPYVLLSPV